MNALVGRCQQIFQTQLMRTAAKAARIGHTQQPHPGVVDQLQQVVAVEGKQRRVHYFQDAGQQSGSLKRAHSLPLQQVGEGVDL